jgi:glycosyltransferase involved in cell wall biosynthesis
MNISARVASSTKRTMPVLPRTTHVCMHVRGVARTDIRVLREATALAEAGYAVSIVDVESDLDRPVEEDIDGIHIKHIIKPHWLVPVHLKPLRFVRTTHKFLYSTFMLIRMSADIYHAHDVNALPACYVAARWHRKPLIFDAHELPLDGLEEQGNLFITILVWLLACMLSRCAGVITVSSPIGREIYRWYHASEVTLIRNVPVYQSVPKSDRLRQRLGLSSDVQIALYQGNLQLVRKLDRLIRAAKFLDRGIVIVLMGKDIGATQRQLEALIAEEGVADRVKILPPVPYAELLDWTASADIGLNVFPPEHSLSIKMCLPNKFFEYLMAGLPVLTSQLDAVVDIVRICDVGQVVSSLAPQSIAMAINEMLKNGEELARMRRNALVAAKQELNWERESEQLISLYQNILREQSDKKSK